ncbi:anti-sigma-I factor RsgI family protein [Coprococcus sp. AF21-14LB]|uniref:anti-sigma-I factor RsgI family protein n=1 Tax=Coprococcus sp. AF21-14LB TaxID=2292231 RepID=UPI000E4C9A51|nr:hypothetical protein [Coprococcus sp. AF21-14LB]RGS81334.1 hypothetical protein DWX73_03150 [Coprococcus sp. AF21-14LB]
MNGKIKEAFEQIQAENELKEKTKEFIFQKTNGYSKVRTGNYKYLVSVFACAVLLFIGGHWLYFTPTVEISIDINPSIELEINRFDKIISLESYNADGQELIKTLNVKFKDYSEAMNQIFRSEDIISLLEKDEIMTIAVIGSGNTQSEKVLSNLQSYTEEKHNTYCYYAHSEEVENAHESGLSCGKYKAYLELKEVNPDITVDDIHHMTMREIRNMIDELSIDENNSTDYYENETSHRQGGHCQKHK